MPKIVYIGPNDDVEVPSLNLSVRHGETIDVPADAVDSFLCQVDNWKPAKGKEGDSK